jgi:phosphoglycerate dehydrogenase-like enzyme
MNILVTIPRTEVGKTFLSEDVIHEIAQSGTVRWNESAEQFTKTEMMRLLPDADACLTGWGTPRFDAEIIESAPNLRIIAHTGGTVFPLVDPIVFQKGIHVSSGNKIYAMSVAEGVLAYMLCALRKIPYYNSLLHQGGWKKDEDWNYGLFNKTIGLIGYGATTKYLMELLPFFKVKIKIYSKHLSISDAQKLGAEKASLQEIFSSCDIVSVHASQRPENIHLISKGLLSMLKPGSLFINTSRGNIVDETALCDELKSGRFSAVLDVYEMEPLAKDSILRTLPNVILIPHMAGPTVDLRSRITLEMLGEIKRCEQGLPLQYEISEERMETMTQERNDLVK